MSTLPPAGEQPDDDAEPSATSSNRPPPDVERETYSRVELPPSQDRETSTSDDGLEALWENVLAHWDDDKAHAAFLQYAQRGMHLPEAGARYRRIKESEPERAEMAQKQLQALIVLALALLQERQQEPVAGPPRWLTVITFVLALAALAFLARQVLGSS